MLGILRLDVWKGLIGGAIGTALGVFITMIIRSLQGLDNTWDTTATSPWNVIVIPACVMGTLGFLIGVGSMTDWLKWMVGRKGSDGHYHPKPGVPQWHRYFGMDTNHKVVGIQYGVLGIVVLLIGGLFALIFRTELAEPGLQYLSANDYNSLIGLHGQLMFIAVLLGIGAMANYLVPIMIGAQDMAFPRINGFAFWINVPAAVMLLSSIFLGGFDTGWTAYPPLSVRAHLGMQMALIAVFILGFSSILGGLNLIVTIFLMRAPGMSLFRMPIFVWGVLATSLLQLTATQFIGLSFLMVTLQRAVDIPFFDPARGGDVTLYQHLFWFYSHPTVYIWILPGLGIISEILPVFARKPLFGYPFIAMSSMAIAIMGYLVWAHHMWASAMDPFLRVPFMMTTLTIAVPTGIKFFSWLATLWEGKIRFATPMYFTLGAIVLFLLGGLTGPPSALVVTGLHLHDSHFVVAHFHITVFGGFMFTYFAAIYYWFPLLTGRMYSETLGKIHFGVMFIGFIIFALSLFRVGLLGMRRRIADYTIDFGGIFGIEWQMLATIGAFMAGLGVLVMLGNLVFSAMYGKKAVHNPWRSRSLEWQIVAPPPELNFSALPQIVGHPYDYGLPGSVYAILSPDDQVVAEPVKPNQITPSKPALPAAAVTGD
ncbi:MAG: cbb3-type cytochrome c oxidase subunit I [Anaerolineales bacterium]|nr:cbb3-type cytochrome c oxidase subunit I [Anaerolineales bacterium]